MKCGIMVDYNTLEFISTTASTRVQVECVFIERVYNCFVSYCNRSPIYMCGAVVYILSFVVNNLFIVTISEDKNNIHRYSFL